MFPVIEREPAPDLALPREEAALPTGLPSIAVNFARRQPSSSEVQTTAHPYAEVTGFASVDSAPPERLPLTRMTADALDSFDDAYTPGSVTPDTLQVLGVSISGASLHMRFTQAIDIGRLGHAVVVMQGSRVVQGVLVPDPDGMGLTFIGVDGVWADGEYTLLLRSAVDGLLNLGGQWLDGDYDGHAGGDFRATFNVHGGATRFGAMLVGLGGVVSLLNAPGTMPAATRPSRPARTGETPRVSPSPAGLQFPHSEG